MFTITLRRSCGEQLHVVTIIDDSNELVTANAYIDGNLVNTATVANGGITSNGDGTSTATLNIWLLACGTHTYLATWEDANGTGKEESITTLLSGAVGRRFHREGATG